MKRQYESGSQDKVKFFVGTEIEKTPAEGLRTLFVVGLHDSVEVDNLYQQNDCEHIFFGANHSFLPKTPEKWQQWETFMEFFLEQGILCSLDIPLSHAEEFLDCTMVEYDNFIPQIRVPVPYIRQWNYNTMLKIDDKDFKATNPGVWCHNLHELQSRERFTDWSKYGLDKIIE